MKPSSRRAFLKLVTAGSAAWATGVATPLARAATRPAKRARAAATVASPAMKREIANQQAYVARALKVIREHVLPAGSAPAFTFTPRRTRRRRGVR